MHGSGHVEALLDGHIQIFLLRFGRKSDFILCEYIYIYIINMFLMISHTFLMISHTF